MILVNGNSGEAVRVLQANLKELGYPVVVDGYFGPATEKAVLYFQRNNGLFPNGKYGPETQVKMDAAIAAKRAAETSDSVPAGRILRVQVGGFTVYSEAEDMKIRLIKAGFPEVRVIEEDK